MKRKRVDIWISQITALIKALRFSSLELETQNSLKREMLFFNNSRFVVIAVVILALQTMNVIHVLFFSKSGLSSLNNRLYFSMYLFLYISALICLVIRHVLRNRPVMLQQYYVFFTLIWVLWHAILSSMDLRHNPNIMVFVTGMLSISFLIRIKPVQMLSILTSGLFALLFFARETLSNGTTVNAIIVTIVTMLIFCSHYLTTLEELGYRQKMISQENRRQVEKQKMTIMSEQQKELLCYSRDCLFLWDKELEILIFSDEKRICDEDRKSLITWLLEEKKEKSSVILQLRIQDTPQEYLVERTLQYDCDGIAVGAVGIITKASREGRTVYGTLKAIPSDKMLSDENVRFSAIMEQTENGIKLVHSHFSNTDIAQEQGNYFEKTSVRVDNQSLRAELSIRERQLANLTKNIPGGAHQCANDADLTLLSMSDGFLTMFGYSKTEIETQFEGKFINMVYPSDRAAMIKSTYAQLENGSNIELEYRVLRKVGQPIWVLDQGRLIDDGNGGACFYCLLIDITERKRQQEELRLSLERHKVIVDQATDIIFEWDILHDTLEFSPNWKKRFGYEAINKNISGSIPLSQNIHPEDMQAFVKIMKDTAAGIPYSETEFRIRNLIGNYYWSRIRATVQYNVEGRPIKAVGVIVDIDEEKKQKQELLLRAQYDTLTGIYNKATINVLVEQKMCGKYSAGNGMPDYHALLIIDVDYFKAVNDNYGHLCGDSVLSDVAAVLKGSVRSGDLVGRIGGDEFLVYLPEVTDELSVHHKAEQIIQALSCIRPESGAHSITCSIGVSVLPRTQNNYGVLYQTADIALYQRKNSGRDGFTFYEPEMGEVTPSQQISVVGKSIVSDEGNVANEWLAQYAFRTLYEAKDIEVALDRLLEIIGRSFDVSRAYIFESSENRKYCSNTFEWCGDDVAPQIEKLQNIAYVDELGDYLTNFNEQGIFYCHKIEDLHPDVYAVLKPQGIRSMLQCAILDEGEFVGYVGFDECRENRTWNEQQVAAFKLTADVLSTFLMKLREKHKKIGGGGNESGNQTTKKKKKV